MGKIIRFFVTKSYNSNRLLNFEKHYQTNRIQSSIETYVKILEFRSYKLDEGTYQVDITCLGIDGGQNIFPVSLTYFCNSTEKRDKLQDELLLFSIYRCFSTSWCVLPPSEPKCPPPIDICNPILKELTPSRIKSAEHIFRHNNSNLSLFGNAENTN